MAYEILFIPGSGLVDLYSADPLDASAAVEIIVAAAYIDGVPVEVQFNEMDQSYYLFIDPADEELMHAYLSLVYAYEMDGIESVLELEPLFTPYLKNAGKWAFDGGYFDGNFNSAAMDAAIADLASAAPAPGPQIEVEPLLEGEAPPPVPGADVSVPGTPAPGTAKEPGMLQRIGFPVLFVGSLALLAWSLN